jgi:Trp operon repressor
MDISSLATHLKCKSDLKKMYPGVEVKLKDIRHAMAYFMTNKERDAVSSRIDIIERLKKSV